MIVSVKTARTKWCPLKRVALSEGMSANWSGNMASDAKGYGNVYDETRCIASDCMMWRRPDPLALYERGAGYCGLAGLE